MKNEFPKRFSYIKGPEFLKYRHKGVTWQKSKDVINDLSDWSRGRLRYHPTGDCLSSKGDEDRALCWKVYRDALIKTGNEDLIEKWNLDNVAFNADQSKDLSAFMKKKGNTCEERWRYLVDMQRLGDYLPYKPIEEFKDTIVEWVYHKKIHTWLGDEEKWYQKFEESCRKVIFRDGVSPRRFISVDDFIKNGDIWCTSGSGFEPEVGKMKVYDVSKQDEIEVKKNKWSVRWQMSNSEAKHLMMRKRYQMCKAVQKAEPGKVRAVISSDVSLYLKMTYISLFLDQIFKNRRDTTLYMNGEERDRLWQKMAKDGTWRMPLDQSAFDQNATQRQVLIIVKVLKDLLKHFVHKKDVLDELLEIMDKIEFALSGGYVIVGDHKIEVRNGVLSGWRWTAMLDTIINLVELDMAQDLVKEVTGEKISLVDYNAQGDDDWLKIEYYRHCVMLWLAYESFNLEVNPGKFFVSRDRDEYLRRVYDKDIVTGYPARSVTSIVFRNPISPQEAVGSARVREGLGKWKLFSERLDHNFLDSWFQKRWMEDAINSVHGMTKDIIENWLMQDCVQGGLGFDRGVLSGSLIPTSAEKIQDMIIVNSPGANEWREFAETYGVHKVVASRFIVSTLDVPDKISIPKWVKYIYTAENINSEIPHGLEKNISGSVAVGEDVRLYAWAKKLRWFPSMSRLKHTRYYTDWDFSVPIRYIFKEVGNFNTDVRFPLEHKEGISRTLAQLSEEPSLVWKDDMAEKLKHKPKSWVSDFYKGKLKAAVPYISGYGSDIVGGIAQRLLNNAINIFLLKSHPSMEVWYNLQRNIVEQTYRRVTALSVRVVE